MHYPFHKFNKCDDVRRAAAAGDVDAAFKCGQAVGISRCLSSALIHPNDSEHMRSTPILSIYEWCEKP
jgi:hypothetical protein